MKMLNAYTFEVDDFKLAVAQLHAQINPEENLCANSAGFVTCSYDFIESGMVEALSAALPFDIVGCTTLTNASSADPEAQGQMVLCLSVLTADDCQFAAAHTGSLLENSAAGMGAAWQSAASQLPSPPKMALVFAPMLRTLGGEIMLDELDVFAHDVPIFGTIASDFDTAQYSNSFTFHNGEASQESISMLLISGNLSPYFVVRSASEENTYKQKALITASKGSMLQRVNNMTAREYLHSIGLTPGNGVEGLSSIPFVVDYHDGTPPVARAIYMLMEDGSAVCGGAMPEGSLLTVAAMTPAGIMETAQDSMEDALARGPGNGLILFPCLGRNMLLSGNPMEEIDLVRRIAGDSVPWHLAYSGGEIAPMYTEAGKTLNRFHNYTFIACAF